MSEYNNTNGQLELAKVRRALKKSCNLGLRPKQVVVEVVFAVVVGGGGTLCIGFVKFFEVFLFIKSFIKIEASWGRVCSLKH